MSRLVVVSNGDGLGRHGAFPAVAPGRKGAVVRRFRPHFEGASMRPARKPEAGVTGVCYRPGTCRVVQFRRGDVKGDALAGIPKISRFDS